MPAAGNVSAACSAAGVGRRTYYDWVQRDEEFRARLKDAEQEAAERLEAEAYRRAVEGYEEPSRTLLHPLFRSTMGPLLAVSPY